VAGAAAVWVALLAVLRIGVAPPERCPDVTVSQLRASARGAVNWLARNQEPDGTWLYEYTEDQGETDSPYSLTRHAGVMMSLYQAASDGIPGAFEVAELGAEFALDRLIRQRGWAAFGEPGEDVRVGATALLVAALIERRGTTGDDQHDPMLRSLGRFLVSQVQPDGSVLAAWDDDTRAPVPGEYSKYYTGEAFWALARLERAFPGEGWARPARAVGNYLSTRRDEAEDFFPPVPDQWAAYGLAEMGAWPAQRIGSDEARYARRLAGLLGVQVRGESQRREHGLQHVLRKGTGRAAGVGTLGEGLGALWRLSGTDPRLADVRDDIGERVTCVAGMLADRQVSGGLRELRGAWVRDGVTRMDDQQHALSTLLAGMSVLR